jgi:hypothetical protein
MGFVGIPLWGRSEEGDFRKTCELYFFLSCSLIIHSLM